MKRGEIWWINFEPAVGDEIKKKRPAVIVSNDISNKYLNRFQVVPITSNVERLYPSETYISIKNKQGKAMADQLTAVSRLRFISKMGTLSESEMGAIEKIIKIQLDIA